MSENTSTPRHQTDATAGDDGPHSGHPAPKDGAPSLVVLATGGTIDKRYSVAGDLDIGPPPIAAILDEAGVHLDLTVEPVLAKDSLEITDADRALVATRISELHQSGTRRILITHGTDTMTDTATHLLRHLGPGSAMTVVLTGAMQPAAMRFSDAPFNIGAALVAAQTLPPSVYLCMNGRIFPAGTVTKDRALGRFVDALDVPGQEIGSAVLT
ncbi:asparaginase domain-containing protein [Kocuria sp. U4B]